MNSCVLIRIEKFIILPMRKNLNVSQYRFEEDSRVGTHIPLQNVDFEQIGHRNRILAALRCAVIGKIRLREGIT